MTVAANTRCVPMSFCSRVTRTLYFGLLFRRSFLLTVRCSSCSIMWPDNVQILFSDIASVACAAYAIYSYLPRWWRSSLLCCRCSELTLQHIVLIDNVSVPQHISQLRFREKKNKYFASCEEDGGNHDQPVSPILVRVSRCEAIRESSATGWHFF